MDDQWLEWRGRDEPALAGIGDGDNRRPAAHLMGGVSPHSILSRGNTVLGTSKYLQEIEEGPEGHLEVWRPLACVLLHEICIAASMG